MRSAWQHRWCMLTLSLCAFLSLLLSGCGGKAGTDPAVGLNSASIGQRTAASNLVHAAPILIVTSTNAPFGRYYAEILRTEGFNDFAEADITTVTADTLAAYDVVLLAKMPLTSFQAAMLSSWVNGGGNLIAMAPDSILADLLGLTRVGLSLSNGYLLVDTSTSPGNGIVNQVMQFHGSADQYNLNGATAVATLYSTATTALRNPAVTWRSVGAGQASAFTYDLAASVVYTRQGNPAWAAQERDGTAPIRPDDKFYGNAAGDVQPDWIDLHKVAIPQADEQQRLLANLILYMNASRKPLPRFWYFPNGKKAVVIMTGDDHGNGGTIGRFQQFESLSPAGCSVANWECVRGTAYLFASTPMSDAQAGQFTSEGFEVGLHINTNCADFSLASLQATYDQQVPEFQAKFPSAGALLTERHHCVVWSDWSSGAEVELNHGMRLDTTYYYWPPGLVNDVPGLFTGSAMPMRFARLDGSLIDVYMAATQMTDESGQSYPYTVDTLLDRALGAEGYYGAYTVNAHADVASSSVSDAVVNSAQARGVPIVSARQMLTWLDARNASSFSAISFNAGALTFSVAKDPAANGLQGMLPMRAGTDVLSELSRGGSPVSFSVSTIKGVDYAFFSAEAGTYLANYNAATITTSSVWASSATPTNPLIADSNAVELGVKFTSDVDGFITGIRFYKGAGSTGTHIGHLWSASGTLLASATFTAESASGWQQVLFATPVAISANTVYVASYFAPNGRYAGDNNYFATVGIDHSPLHLLPSGASGGNGVYRYSSVSAFPTDSFKASNYWVDVVLSTSGTGTGTGTNVCATPPNAIVAENCLAGNPASEWDINGAGDMSIQGFATQISVNRGETVSFKVNTSAASYRFDIYRLGYYGGLGARKVASVTPSAALPQFQPGCLNDAATGLIDCGNWSVSGAWTVPASAVSGIYVAKLVRPDTGGASHIVFIVRNDAGNADLLFQTSDTTWQAYNSYGGNSFYSGAPAGRAYKVSYNRPFNTRAVDNGQDWLFNSEYPMLRWLEANGYDLSYCSGVDTDRSGSLIPNHRVFLSVGHDEYWSGAQRTNVEAARDTGVNLAFFSGNEIFWKTRWESSIDGTGTPYRTLVSYKETHANAKIDPSAAWTGTWRDPRFSPPADGGRPENALTGTLFMVNDGATTAIQVPAPDGRMRFWRNTEIATLAAGASVTLPSGTLGYEWDIDADNGWRPPGLMRLSTTAVPNAPVLQDFGSNYAPGLATHALTLYKHRSGARVFGAGTIQWPWGLDASHDRSGTPSDLRMQQATVNLLADMNAQPASLQGGLVATSASTDATAPSSSITSPSAGAILTAGSAITISGTASDAGGGVVGGVEVSVDGGTTWHPASGRENWAYNWTLSATAGPVTLKSRAVDDSGNLESAGPGVTVNSGVHTCPCTLWSATAVPTVASHSDTGAVNLGVKFTADLDGFITGIRFYKGANNIGTHVATLWSINGAPLASATFSAESASGWQQVNFPTPVAVTAHTVYIASYFAPNGRYAGDNGYFASTGIDNSPLHALQDAAGNGNGVYVYGSGPAFPTSTYRASNYWVDVVFTTK